MISYLILSALSMGLLLLLYHAVLEQEKIHHFNRGFLIFSLIFSLIIPTLPVGVFSFTLPWAGQEQFLSLQSAQGLQHINVPSLNTTAPAAQANSASIIIHWAILIIYVSVAAMLFIRFLRIIHRIQMKVNRNRAVLYNSYPIVLLNEPVASHTFLRTIFVNRNQFENEKITPEILRHESTHARQLHTLDILFVELLKIVLWFNPVLYFYKKAILLNHEFLADQAVISTGSPVSSYQLLLFKNSRLKPSQHLSSNFSYSVTKKRLIMMTKPYSHFRSALKMTMLLPIFLTLALFFGCKSTPSNVSENEVNRDAMTIELLPTDIIRVDGNVVQYSEFKDYISDLPVKPEIVRFRVSPEVSMGLITDVQKQLRRHNILRINYKTVPGIASTDSTENLNRTTKMFLKESDHYMSMGDEYKRELEESYSRLMSTYEALKKIQQSMPDAPPPPPIPPSPADRLNAEPQIQDPEPVQAPPPPPVEG